MKIIGLQDGAIGHAEDRHSNHGKRPHRENAPAKMRRFRPFENVRSATKNTGASNILPRNS